jgi:drug/metabolite transporter (DMT)-like permease
MGWNPPTVADLISHTVSLALLSATVYGIASAIRKGIGKGSRRRWVQGGYVVAWAVSGYASGGMTALVCLWLAGTRPSIWSGAIGGGSGFGLVAGVVIGNVIGAVASRDVPDEPEPMPRQIEPEPADAKKGGKWGAGAGTAEG